LSNKQFKIQKKQRREPKGLSEFFFSRKISLLDTIMIGIGSTLGSTVFILISAAANESSGGIVLLAFFFNFLIALLIGGTYAECASRFPVNGGGFSFVKEAYGNKALYLGWLIWLGNTAYGSLCAMAIGLYLHYIIPFIDPLVFALIFLTLFTLINCTGSKGLANIQKPITISLLLALFIAAIFLLLLPPSGGFTPFIGENGIISLFPVTALLFLAFVGFEGIATISEEIENPRKIIPKALFITIILTAAIYLFVVFAIFSSTSLEEIRKGEGAILRAVESNLIVYYLVFGCAIFALVSSLSVALMAASRNVYALSRDDFLDRKWSELHPKFQSPTKALMLTYILAAIILISDRFLFGGNIEFIADIANISYMIVVACVGLSVIKFRSQEKNMEKYDREIFKIPFYPWSVYLCIGLPFILIIFLKPITIVIAILWFLMGFVIYQFQRK